MLKNNNSLYLWASKRIPHLYELGWRIARKIKTKKLNNSPLTKDIKKYAMHFKQVIEEFEPTSIVCTHNYSGALIAYMKQQKMLPKAIKTITVMFDYVLCPFWDTNKYLDYCITPAEFCHKDLLKLGYKPEQLKCFGFPVNAKFCLCENKAEIRKKLGLENKFTFFSIAGGNGLGNSLKLLKNILKAKGDYQVIIVCGKNQKDKDKIDAYIQQNNIKNVQNFGFVDNINELMNASDIAFARGGGNGISECFYSGLPVIFRTGLIINERENKNIFVKMGFGYAPKNKRQITKTCQFVLDNPQTILKQQQKIKDFIKPNALKNICDFVVAD